MKNYIQYVYVLFCIFCISHIQAQENTPPNWTWATNIAGFETVTDANNRAMDTDSSGNMYTMALVDNKIKIVKYNADGTLAWSRDGNSAGSVYPRDITVDADGNYYITGSYTGDLTTFGTTILDSPGYGHNDFIVKYAVTGEVIWAKSTGDTYSTYSYGTSISVDANKNVYISTDRYRATSSNRYWRSTLSKFNVTGDLQWNKSVLYDTSTSTAIESIDTDNFGNIYAVGRDQNRAVVYKYDPFGNVVWGKQRSENSTLLDVVVDNVGNSYVTGRVVNSSTNDVLITKYDAAGNKVWEQQGIGSGNDFGQGITIDTNGNIYVTGGFQEKVTFGPIELENLNSGTNDIFVTKLNNLGDIVWGQQAGNNGADAGLDIGVDAAGNCYINGYFTLNTVFGDTTLTGNNQFIPFVAKLGDFTADALTINTQPVASNNFNAGGAISVPFITKGTFPSDTKFTVQLSNSSGSFFNPTFIGVGLTSPINAVIPSLTIPGSGYRVRVISETPEVIGTDNGSALTINSNTQLTTPNWTWAKNITGFESVTSASNRAMDTDEAGNMYTMALVDDKIKIVKYNTDGTLAWSRDGKSAGSVYPRDITVDADGNYYITGSYTGDLVTFGTTVLATPGYGHNDFIVKYATTGEVIWAKSTGDTYSTYSYGTSISVDANKNVYISTDRYRATSSNRYWRSTLSKFNVTGDLQWNKSVLYDTSTSTTFESIDTDDFGNIYAVGRDQNRAVVYKYDPFGNVVWGKQRSENSTLLDVVVDNVGNSYVTGRVVNSSTNDVLITKYDAAGNKVWEQQGIGSGNDFGQGIAIDTNGNTYVTGGFQHNTDFSTLNVTNSNSGYSDVFVTKYDNDGNIIWIQQAGNSGVDAGLDIGTDNNGNCYINGYYTVKSDFGDTTLQSANQYTPFLAKIGESAPTTLVGNAIVKGENFCGGSVITVDFAIGGKYEDDNVFTAQLSDATGSFDNPVNIGTLESAQNTSIYAIIPNDTPKGEGYRIRVVSSNPALIGADNSIDIKINFEDCSNNTTALVAKPIVAAEYFFNTDPGVGNGTSIAITSGLLIEENIEISLPDLDEGFHSIFIRTKDEDGDWSMYDGRVFYIQPQATVFETSPVVAGEYFFDTEPGVGNGTPLKSFDSNTSVDLVDEVSVEGLSEGFHSLFFRTKNAKGVWSMYEGRIVYVQPGQNELKVSPIVAAEYYFNEDPGLGSGTAITTGAPVEELTLSLDNIDTSPLQKGTHNVYIRVKNEDGVWSLSEKQEFNICTDVLEAPEIAGNSSNCAGDSLTLTASDVTNATSYEWFGPNNFTANTQSITINSLSDAHAGEYSVRAINENAECKEGNSKKIEITVNTTDAPTGETAQTLDAGSTLADIIVQGSDIKWYASTSDAINQANELPSTTVLTTSSSYYATQTLNVCASKTYLTVAITLQYTDATLKTHIFLQSAYQGNGLMSDALRASGNIPTTSPYADNLTCNATVFDVTGNDAIVDWVWVELRDKNDSTNTLYETSALLQRDGDVVALDGTSPVSFNIASDNYYVMLAHRNHIGVLTATAVNISSDLVDIDFTNNLSLVTGGTNGIATLSDNKYALFSGDYSGDGQIQNSDRSGIEPLRGTSGYTNADLDMNSEVQNSDIQNVLNPNIGKGKQFNSRAVNLKLYVKRAVKK